MPNRIRSSLEQGVAGRRAASAAVAKDSASVRKALIFYLGEQAYGLELDAIREILAMSLLSQPPMLPPALAGFLNLSGVAVPVVKLARLFGLSEQEPRLYTPLLIMRGCELPLAFQVDAVKGIAEIEESAIVPFHENDCALGLATLGEANVILLSAQRLLREQEQRLVSELAVIEQARLADLQEQST